MPGFSSLPLPQPVRVGDLVRPASLLPGVPVLAVELPPLLLLVRDGALAQPLPPEDDQLGV